MLIPVDFVHPPPLVACVIVPTVPTAVPVCPPHLQQCPCAHRTYSSALVPTIPMAVPFVPATPMAVPLLPRDYAMGDSEPFPLAIFHYCGVFPVL